MKIVLRVTQVVVNYIKHNLNLKILIRTSSIICQDFLLNSIKSYVIEIHFNF